MGKQKIILIALAVFSISILFSQSFIIRPIEAQLAFTVSPLASYSGNTNNQSNCQYISSTEVWCSSTSGIKVINPTSRAITNTLYSGIDIDDIECSASLCFSWHDGDTASANLTGWTLAGKTKFNSTLATMTGGASLGESIDLATVLGSVTLLFPASSTSCIGSGGTSLKGLCIMAGDTFQKTRFISSGDTGASAILFNIKWSETLASIGQPTLNNALLAFQDGAGTRTLRIIDLSDSDTTFANTQTCLSGSIPSLQATAIYQVFVYGTNYYVPIDNGATGYYAQLPITSTTCATTVTYPTSWDNPTSLSTDSEFFYTSSYDGATKKSAVQVYNTTGSAIATYNITNTSGAGEQTFNGWYHGTEGELQVIRGSNLVVFTVQAIGSGVEVCIDTDLNGIADLCFTDTNGDGVADNGQLGALGAYRSNANLTSFGTDVFCAFGISTAACTNKDIQTNGVGLTYLMILVIWSYAFLVGTHIFAVKKIQKENIQVMDAIRINPILLLAMLVIDSSIAFYLSWIPNTIFYTIIVILIGLAGFGIYRQVKGGE